MSDTVTAQSRPSDYVEKWSDARPERAWGFRRRSRALLRSTLLSTLSHLRFRRQERFIRCLYCHHVFGDQITEFRRLLCKLLNDADFVDSETCIALTNGDSPLDGRYFHLSFDDGFANVVTNAAPVLADLKIPGIVFVPTAFVGSDIDQARRFFCQDPDYSGVVRFATWSELAESGLEIGSHTRNHVRLSSIVDIRLMQEEVAGSKTDIETQLGRACNYISWPFGRESDVTTEALSVVREAGYRGCFGAFRAPINPGETSSFEIPRHHFEPQWPFSHVRYFAEGNQGPW